MDKDKLEYNKALVARFFKELFIAPQPNLAFIEEFVSEDYLQHNPLAGQGRQGLRDFLVNVYPKLRASEAEIASLDMRLIAEGDLVVAQSLQTRGMLVDIFRIEDGRLVEHWDAFRPAPGAERMPGF